MQFEARHFFPIMPSQVEASRPHLTPLLTEFDLKTCFASPDDVFQQVASGESSLWAYHDGEKFCGVVAARILKTSAGRICHLWLCCGHDVESLFNGALAILERWATDMGCYSMEIVGRKGWKRVLSGYTHKADVLEKILVKVH